MVRRVNGSSSVRVKDRWLVVRSTSGISFKLSHLAARDGSKRHDVLAAKCAMLPVRAKIVESQGADLRIVQTHQRSSHSSWIERIKLDFQMFKFPLRPLAGADFAAAPHVTVRSRHGMEECAFNGVPMRREQRS